MEITVNRNYKPNLSGLNTSPLNDNLNDDEFAFTRAEKIKLAHLSTGSTGGSTSELLALVSGLTETVNNNYN